jgi:hypothetical protein
MAIMNLLLGLSSLGLARAATVTYAVPTSAPTTAAALDPAPVGISYVCQRERASSEVLLTRP